MPLPDLTNKVAQAAEAIHKKWPRAPQVGIILGTGLTRLADSLETEAKFDFAALPHFPDATAPTHRGRLVCGQLAGRDTIILDGRSHVYEGYSAAQTTFPIRVMSHLGVELLILTNAAGGLNPRFSIGDVMLIDDHLNLMALYRKPDAPALSNLSASVPQPNNYDPQLIRQAQKIARQEGINLHQGVYVGVTGPNYETRAEYRFLRQIGGDAVGMSTVPEALVAARCGLRVLALSTITNICLPDALTPTHCEEVVQAAERAEDSVRRIIQGVLESYAIY